MSEIIEKEVITQELFWFNNTRKMSDKQQMQFEALRLTNKSNCTFIKIIDIYKKNKDEKNIVEYYIVAERTKQKLLLLKHMIIAWVWGSNFIITNSIDLN